MRKILIAVILFMWVGCNNEPADLGNQNNNDYKSTVGFGLRVMSIDSCEYVIYKDDSHGSVAMVHHGNCHNTAHKK